MYRRTETDERARIAALSLCAALVCSTLCAADVQSSLAFFANAPRDYDYGAQTAIPPGFGAGEFTFELWIKPDDSFPVGPISDGDARRDNWASEDVQPYSVSGWWFTGNFLLDGHNNLNFRFRDGTFSLQLYCGGRLRWLLGDGEQLWGLQAYPATNTPSLLDGGWHHVTLVRRWSGGSSSNLEIWIDGNLVNSQTSPRRTDMRTFWDDWSAFPADQKGWFWGAEKQAAKTLNSVDQYEDYKGLVDEARFYTRAKTALEIADNYRLAADTLDSALVGLFAFSEGTGVKTEDDLSTSAIDLVNMKSGYWSPENAPLEGPDTASTRGAWEAYR